ncbi:hypothetical protein F4859DRAFT_374578 [Xylaria cf. heliscus]|nr:hypothetical protein F4859DRAFT_374578 [Xylaria cf. heliscus]
MPGNACAQSFSQSNCDPQLPYYHQNSHQAACSSKSAPHVHAWTDRHDMTWMGRTERLTARQTGMGGNPTLVGASHVPFCSAADWRMSHSRRLPACRGTPGSRALASPRHNARLTACHAMRVMASDARDRHGRRPRQGLGVVWFVSPGAARGESGSAEQARATSLRHAGENLTSHKMDGHFTACLPTYMPTYLPTYIHLPYLSGHAAADIPGSVSSLEPNFCSQSHRS